MKTYVLSVATFLTFFSAHADAKDHQGTVLSVRAVAYRAIPHENTSYYTAPGRSNTSCFGSANGTATNWGFITDINLNTNTNCSTVTTPPSVQPVTISWLEVYNLVEANGQGYTIRCTARWVGSACSWLTPGDTFSAEVKDTTMWITAHRGGNMGKQMRAKYAVLDLRPIQASTFERSGNAGSPAGIVPKTAENVEAASEVLKARQTMIRETPQVVPTVPSPTAPRVSASNNVQAGTCDLSPSAQNGNLAPITICSVPSGAVVVVHGTALGTTPLTTLLAPGSYGVKVLAPGYFEWSHSIRVEAGMPQGVMAQLKAAEQQN